MNLQHMDDDNSLPLCDSRRLEQFIRKNEENDKDENRAAVNDIHPQFWNKEQVREWISWCGDEFSLNLHAVQVDKFAMNGKALMMLQKEDFCERLPGTGDVIHNALHTISNYFSAPLSTRGLFPEPARPRFGSWSASPSPEATSYSSTLKGVMWPDPPVKIESNIDGCTFFKEHIAVKTIQVPTAVHSPEHSSVHSPEHSPLHSPSPLHSSEHSPLHPPLHPPELLPMQSTVTGAYTGPILTHGCLANNARGSPKSFQNADNTTLPPRKRRDMLAFELNNSNVPSEKVPDDTTLDEKKSTLNANNNNNKLLWEFISELLQKPEMDTPVRWYDSSTMTFRITDTSRLAKLWGEHKQKENMTYEKLSRALRYYYKMGIISKVRGKKLTYRFTTPPTQIKKGIRGAKPGVPHKRRKKEEKSLSKKGKLNGKQREQGVALDLSVKRSVMCNKEKRKMPEKPATSPCAPSSTSACFEYETDVIKPEEDRTVAMFSNDSSYDEGYKKHSYDTGCLDLRCFRKVMEDSCTSPIVDQYVREDLDCDSTDKLHDHRPCHSQFHAMTSSVPRFHSDPSAFSVVRPLSLRFEAHCTYPYQHDPRPTPFSPDSHADYVSFVLNS